ncbi:hypothetical protein A4H97_20370 [Niastella yeongjuensis]|uniref:SusD/RagB family nutrient-binding outer membrane lipoprotein n=1 Tax=Niastella yeongjuensis TaxID=354355 RepID=A0A1V9FC27_9BACT|nr:SusD/RagB family nutrient-binding outer membrane lipoprotein [Niastella yeongjuensis]OQP55945.1 hypothetical protein A4H97_20370 [Niastella yeongjuensis]SEP26457.1 Susd and RagB outer membrane lipoprotein [Niastella yeongjuensis]
MNLSIKKSLYIIAAAASTIFVGCKKQLDINNDPNKAPVVTGTAALIYPSAMMSTTGRIGGELNIIGGIWSQYYTQNWTSNQYKTIDAYNIQSTDYQGSYAELYSGALNDYYYALDTAKKAGEWKYYLMGTVMNAFTVATLVDLYDQIPYSEAFQGKANINPKFDDGYTIYQDLLKRIDTALSKDITTERDGDPADNDFIFGGDMDSWVKFANTLKLKFYLRMINAHPEVAEAGIRDLYTNNAAFLDIDAAMKLFTSTPDKQNPFYAYNIYRLNTGTNLKASATFTTWLNANNDPRIVAFYDSTDAVPMHQGDFLSKYSRVTTFNQSPTDPVEFISEAESYFLQAEALERYFGGTGAKALYDKGVTAAFAALGYGDEVAPFIQAGGVYEYPAAGTLPEKIEAIIVQKWAHFAYGCHSLEAFFDKNRTGYPRTSPVYSKEASYVPGQFVFSPNGVTGGKFPKRLVFPDSERSRNKNTPAEVPITKPVWWAIQ